jgi:competence protein ComEA
LESAGGFTERADINRINLAGTLTDGMMIFFPEVGEEMPEGYEIAAGTATGQTPVGEKTDSGLVNINTAGVEDLCTLPGIGESKAKAVVEYREEHGPFAAKEEIMNVSGIGTGLYKKIEDLICV